MGFIYFIGPSLNIDGRTPLPVSMNNITPLIVAGYVSSLVVMCLLPQWVIRLSRASTVIAFLTVLGLFFPLDVDALTVLIYIHCFCCCFMIGFETVTMVYFFSENSAMRHLLLVYPFGYAVVAVVQNDFVKIDFAAFHILTIIMLALLLVFFCKMPTKSCPRFVKKEDGLIVPKRFFTGVFLLSFLSMLLGMIAPAVAAQFEHGVFVAYMSCAVFTLAVYALHKLTRHHPLQIIPYVIGIAVVGYVLLCVSNYHPGLALVACALIGVGMTTCLLVPLFGILMAKQYPSKFIAPGIIFLAMVAVIVQSVLVEAFRSQAVLLNLNYLVIVVILAFIFILVEPYLIYAMHRRFADAPPDGGSRCPCTCRRTGDRAFAGCFGPRRSGKRCSDGCRCTARFLAACPADETGARGAGLDRLRTQQCRYCRYAVHFREYRKGSHQKHLPQAGRPQPPRRRADGKPAGRTAAQ